MNKQGIAGALAATALFTSPVTEAQSTRLSWLKPAVAGKVAAILPLTGGLKSNGEQMKMGIDAAVAALAKMGISVKVAYYDDKSSADGAKEAVAQAKQDGTLIYNGCFWGVSCSIIATEVAPNPLMGALTGDPKLSRDTKFSHVTMTRIDAEWELNLIFRQLKSFGAPVTVFIQDDPFGQSYAQFLDVLASSHSVSIEKVLFKPADIMSLPETTRYQKLWSTVKSGNNVVIIAGMPHAIGLTKAADAQPKKGILNISNLAGQSSWFYFQQTNNTNALRTAVNVLPHPKNAVGWYIEGFRENAKEPTSTIAFEAYSNVLVMAGRMYPNQIDLSKMLGANNKFNAGVFMTGKDGRVTQ
jgi:ABC-type branched-subunit amino acid transport system substrate-binding protein